MSPTLHLAFWLYIPLAALALLAFFLLRVALFRDRAGATKRRCPKCWYDMSGAPPAPPYRCPECGHLSRTDRDLRRTRHRWPLAILGALLLAPLLTFFAMRDGARAYYALMPKWKLVEEIRVGPTIARRYAIRNPADRGSRFVLISHGKTVLDSSDAADIEFGRHSFAVPPTRRVGAGEDLNGDGIPDLVVFAYSGGAHCCYTVRIIELSDPPLIAATIDARNGMGVLPNGAGERPGQALFNIADQSFDYWNAPHVASPFPSVFYRLQDHHLVLALDQMLLQPSEAPEHRAGEAATLRESLSKPGAILDPLLWAVMLQLLYSGNDAECWPFLDAAWPTTPDPNPPSPAAAKAMFPPPRSIYSTKEDFKKAFLQVLNQSPQWHDFQAARAAFGAGKPIPPATVGNYAPEPPSTPSPSPQP